MCNACSNAADTQPSRIHQGRNQGLFHSKSNWRNDGVERCNEDDDKKVDPKRKRSYNIERKKANRRGKQMATYLISWFIILPIPAKHRHDFHWWDDCGWYLTMKLLSEFILMMRVTHRRWKEAWVLQTQKPKTKCAKHTTVQSCTHYINWVGYGGQHAVLIDWTNYSYKYYDLAGLSYRITHPANNQSRSLEQSLPNPNKGNSCGD